MLQEQVGNQAAVDLRPALAEPHVVQVVVAVGAFQIGQFRRHGRAAHLEGVVQLAHGLLQLVPAPGLFVSRNHPVLFFHQFGPARLALDRQFLVHLRHLLPQVPASGVHHQVTSSPSVAVYLDEVVSSPSEPMDRFRRFVSFSSR